jgi:cytoskeleton protein RodZ
MNVQKGLLSEPPGSVLRDARISAGKSILDVADALNLLKTYVEALESNDYSRFNSPLFARGYIKIYARYLGLDEAPLLNDCDRICRRADESKQRRKSRVMARAKAPGHAGLVIAVLVSLVMWLVSYWVYGRSSGPEIVVTVLPERTASLSTIPSPPTLGETLLPNEVMVSPAPEKVPFLSAAAEIEFKFSESVWIELRDSSNMVVVSGVQPQGSKLHFEVLGPVIFNSAYWPAVQMVYNGKKIELKGLATSNAVRVRVGEL